MKVVSRLMSLGVLLTLVLAVGCSKRIDRSSGNRASGGGSGSSVAALDQTVQDILDKVALLPSVMGMRAEVITQEELRTLEKFATHPKVSAELPKLQAMEQTLLATAAQYLTPEMDQLVAKKFNATLTEDEADLIVAARKTWMNLNLHEGSYFWIRSFDSDPGVARLIHLLQYYDVARRGWSDPARMIDFAWKKSLMADHFANLQSPPLRALVVGGGPNGFLAALKLYAAGMKVRVVEARGHLYTRHQIVRLDPKWTAELAYYWGNDFNWRFKPGTSYTKITENAVAEIPTLNLEAAFQNRFRFLSKHDGIPNDDVIKSEDEDLQITYYTKFKEVRPPEWDVGFTATLQVGQKPGVRTVENLPIDLLVLATGARDINPSLYLSPAYSVTEEKYFGVALWKKVASDKTKKLKNQKDFITLIPHGDLADPRQIQVYDDLHIELGQLIQQNGLEFRDYTQFGQLGQKMALETSSNFLKGIGIRNFENDEVVYIGSQPPVIFGEFLACIENARNKYEGKKGEPHKPARALKYRILNDFFNKAKASWDATLKAYLINDPGNTLVKESRSSSIFPVSQRVIDRPVVMYEKDYKTLIITAIGDALAVPHYFSGSGLSGGRKSSDDLYAAVMDFNQNRSYQVFLKDLFEGHLVTQKFTRKRGERYLKGLTPTEIDQKKEQAMLELLYGKTSNRLEHWILPHFDSQVDGAYLVLIRSDRTEHSRHEGVEDVRMVLEHAVTVTGSVAPSGATTP